MKNKEDMWLVALAILECPYSVELKKELLTKQVGNYVPINLLTTGFEPFDKAIQTKINKQINN